MFINNYNVASAINTALNPVLCIPMMRKLKLGATINCSKSNGLRMVEPGFEPGHAGPRAHSLTLYQTHFFCR